MRLRDSHEVLEIGCCRFRTSRSALCDRHRGGFRLRDLGLRGCVLGSAVGVRGRCGELLCLRCGLGERGVVAEGCVVGATDPAVGGLPGGDCVRLRRGGRVP